MAIAPRELSDAADENLAAHAEFPCRALPRSRVERDPELVLVDSGLACDTFNLICRARLIATSARARIEHALAFFRETGHPFSWWLGPGSLPAELPALLADAGLQPAESELAMALELGRLRDQPPLPEGLTIRRVRTAEELDLFGTISAGNWDPPDQNVVRFYQLAAAAFLDPASRRWLYLAYRQGRSVATAELTVGGGVAGLYNIATIPAWRGRGIGSLMTWTPLRDAAQAGLPWAILQASAMGQGLYARLGFQEFGSITEYK
jgi:ribosomal protein S18 acetylase RimI-like enzyme